MKFPLFLPIPLLGLATMFAFATPTQAQDPFAPRLTATRVNLAHGRVHDIREVGILCEENKRGNAVKGAVEIMDAIAKMPNPLRITLDLNKDGNAPADMKKPSPILVADAAGPLSSGVTLIVAEVPAGGTFGGWNSLATRFSDGNLYATVSIPDAKIVAGQELATLQQLKDYTANSIFFEAPHFGFIVVKNDLTGGSTTVSAKINGKKFSSNYGFASPLQLTLSGKGTKSVKDKTAKVKFFAKLPTSFESPCKLRFAAKSDKETIIMDVVLPASPDDKKQSFRTVRVVFDIKAEVDDSVAISAVASPGPFLEPLPKAPQSVGMKTFQSKGSTLEDTLSIKITKKTGIDYAALLKETAVEHGLDDCKVEFRNPGYYLWWPAKDKFLYEVGMGITLANTPAEAEACRDILRDKKNAKLIQIAGADDAFVQGVSQVTVLARMGKILVHIEAPAREDAIRYATAVIRQLREELE